MNSFAQTRGRQTEIDDVIVTDSEGAFDRAQTKLEALGCRVGLLLSDDSDLTISSTDGKFIQIPGNGSFLENLDCALAAAGDYEVLSIPCLERDAALMGWETLDLPSAAVVARRHGLTLLVYVESLDTAPLKH